MGLSDGVTLIRDVLKDQAIKYADVLLPIGRLCDKLRSEQDKLFVSGASLTVVIPTCYGGQSLLQTVKSLRASKGVEDFRLIVVADRTPITPRVKKELSGLGVELYWNDVPGSQTKKVTQAIEITTSEFTVVTQDDIAFEPWTLRALVNALERDQSLTMVGARILPLKPETLIESAIAALVRFMDRVASTWNDGKNHLSASGRCLAYRTKHLKKFHAPDTVVNSDIYMYLRNRVLGGKFARAPEARVFIRCPQKLRDQIGPSSRYQYLREEMNSYFKLDSIPDYRLPKLLVLRQAIVEFFHAPIAMATYLGIFIYTRLKKQALKRVIDPVWDVDSSTKKV